MMVAKIRISVLLLVLLLIIPLALAPTAVEFVNPGTTPDSSWYPLELAWEHFFEVGTDHTPERFAEMQAMLTTGNSEAAARAGEEAQKAIQSTQQELADADLNTVIEHQARAFQYDEYLQQLDKFNADKPELGAGDVITNVDHTLTETNALISVRETEIENALASKPDSSGQPLSQFEAELDVERTKDDTLKEQFQERVNSESFQKLRQELVDVKQEFAAATKEGKTLPQAPALGMLIEQATEKVLRAETAFQDGQIGKAFGQSVAAEHLLDNANSFFDETVSTEQEKVQKFMKKVNQQDQQQQHRLIEDFSQAKERGIPVNYLQNYEKEREQAQKILQLGQQRQEFYQQKYGELVAEGVKPAEATRQLTNQFTNEYEQIYGEKLYLPPIGVVPELADESSLVDMKQVADNLRKAKAVVVKDYTYTDPLAGYEYTFSDDGYTYTTPLGIEHQVNDPAIKEALKEAFSTPAFENGAEVVSTIVGTPQGKAEYRYMATGYEVRKPDGTSETYSYDVGKHALPGGGFIEINPYGFEVVKSGGERNTFEYHPEYKNYVSPDGYVYMPPEGTAVHNEMQYNYDTGVFTFDHRGQKWNYDPASRLWAEERAEVGRTVTSDGKTYIVTVDKGWTDEQGNAVPPPSGQPGSAVGATGASARFYQPVTQSFAPVGTTAVVEGKTYKVTAEKGWTDENGNPVPPPAGQPSSAMGATGGLAQVGTTAVVDGKTYVVDQIKGWMDVETRKAVPPPSGYSSSSVGFRVGDFGRGVEKNYNYVVDGRAYNLPPNLDPGKVDRSQFAAQMAQFEVGNPRGYDSAFGTDFGSGRYGERSNERFVQTLYGENYGHVRDSVSGQWRPAASKEEADSFAKTGEGRYSPPGASTDGRNYNYVQEGKAYYFPPGVDPGKVSDTERSGYEVKDARGYNPAYNTYFGGSQDAVSGGSRSATGFYFEGTYYPPGTEYTPSGYYSENKYYAPGSPLVGSAAGVGTGTGTGYIGSPSSSVNYGHVKDPSTGTWRQATAEEAAAGGSDYSPPGSGTSGSQAGSNYGINPATGGWEPNMGGGTGGTGTYGSGYTSGYYSGGTSTGGAYYGGSYSSGVPSGGQTGSNYGINPATGGWEPGMGGGASSGGSYSGGSYSGGSSGGSYGSGSTGSSYGGSTGGSYSGGSYGSGSTGSSYGGSTGGSTGGSYSGGSSGSSYGGSTGGSTGGSYSGGSEGSSSGSSGGSTGGDSGSGSSGSTSGTTSVNAMTGNVVRAQTAPTEISPATRWIMRYTGMDKQRK